MLLYQIFTFIYVFDYFLFEHYMTSTWDILHEKCVQSPSLSLAPVLTACGRFGLMLVWGDFVFIPFAFSVQNWFLVDNRQVFSPVLTAAIVAVFAIGFFI